MSGAPTAASGQLLGVLMRRSAPWALGAGVLSVLVLWSAGGRADLLGALLGLAIVLVFYGTDLIALWASNRLVPAATMGLFLGEYLVKVLAIAALLWAFVAWQRHRESSGSDPLVHLDLIKIPPLRSGLVGLFTQNLILMGLFFVVPLYLQLGSEFMPPLREGSVLYMPSAVEPGRKL